jgi:hypothetical protein
MAASDQQSPAISHHNRPHRDLRGIRILARSHVVGSYPCKK